MHPQCSATLSVGLAIHFEHTVSLAAVCLGKEERRAIKRLLLEEGVQCGHRHSLRSEAPQSPLKHEHCIGCAHTAAIAYCSTLSTQCSSHLRTHLCDLLSGVTERPMLRIIRVARKHWKCSCTVKAIHSRKPLIVHIRMPNSTAVLWLVLGRPGEMRCYG